MTLSKDDYNIYHGIELAQDSCIVNCEVESLIQDPEVIRSGRIWYNITEKRIKYSTLGDNDNVIVRDIGIALTHETLTSQDYISYPISKQIIPGTESVYVNGLLQRYGQSYDYTFLNNNVRFTSNNQETDIISISYMAIQ